MKEIVWYKSETVWFSIGISMFGFLQTNIQYLQSLLGDYYGLTYICIGLIGVVLRASTTSKLTIKKVKNV